MTPKYDNTVAHITDRIDAACRELTKIADMLAGYPELDDSCAPLRRIASGSDMTLRGLVAELAEQGVKVSYRTVWNFVHREKISYKKNAFFPPSKIAPA